MSEKIPDFSKERKFNDERWKRQASSRGLFSKEKTPEDFMRSEAKRDDEDFEKKYIRESKREYEIWEEHCKPIRQAFLEQARNPEGVDFVTVNIFMQGGMRAAGIAGAALGQDLLGVNSDTVDYAVGISSGDTVATRFVGGREQLLRGIAMLTGPLADKKFIDIRFGNTIDINYIKKLEEEGEYALDEERIKNAHCKLWTVVTEPLKGSAEPAVRILDKKNIKEGMSTASVSTMSIPKVTGDIPTIDGVTYYDGGFAALPIKEIIAKVKSENPEKKVKVLIFTQASFDAMENIKPERWEAVAEKIMRSIAGPLRGVGSLDSAAIVQQLAKGLVLKENLRTSLDAIEKETDANIGVVWAPPTNLGMMSIDSDEMKMAVAESTRQFIRLSGGEQPDEIPEYVSVRDRLKHSIRDYGRAA